MATINSLGLGSGVLTADVIDKLKSNDTSLIIKPIENKITLETQKKSALDLLKSLMTNFKSSVNALDDDSLYQKRSVSGTNSAVTVTAESGVAVQSFSITDTVLAQKNVKQSGSFSSETATISSGAGTMTLSIGGEDYAIDYTAATTLSDLQEAINAKMLITDEEGKSVQKVKASILQVGSGDYRLILTSGESGSDQNISLSDSLGGTLNTQLLPYNATGSDDGITDNPDGMQDIQAARDSTFKFNGISITRSTNSIDDIISGVTINLLEESTTGANIAITQDVAAISDEMTTFVQNYNTLMSELSDMTTSDTEAGTVGVFNGDNSINSIKREVNKLITSINSDSYSLAKFGIDLSQDGVMSFNSATFTTEFNKDTTLSEKFFSGLTTTTDGNIETVDGVYTSMKTLMERYLNSTGILTNLSSSVTNEIKTLGENKTRSQALLDARYESMTARFIQYDAIISKLENQFSSLQQQISMAINGTSS